MGMRVQDLGATGIMLVSKFARRANTKHGVKILLHKPHVLNILAAYAAKSDDQELMQIFQNIESEVRKYLKQELPNSYNTIPLSYNNRQIAPSTLQAN